MSVDKNKELHWFLLYLKELALNNSSLLNRRQLRKPPVRRPLRIIIVIIVISSCTIILVPLSQGLVTVMCHSAQQLIPRTVVAATGGFHSPR
jgi:hypothetical protein